MNKKRYSQNLHPLMLDALKKAAANDIMGRTVSKIVRDIIADYLKEQKLWPPTKKEN